MVMGGAGCGKTWELCKRVLKSKNQLVLSFTNKAVQNVREKIAEVAAREGVLITHNLDIVCRTFDCFFYEKNVRRVELLRNKEVFVAEYSMVPNKWISLLYEAYEQYTANASRWWETQTNAHLSRGALQCTTTMRTAPASRRCVRRGPSRPTEKTAPGTTQRPMLSSSGS